MTCKIWHHVLPIQVLVRDDNLWESQIQVSRLWQGMGLPVDSYYLELMCTHWSSVDSVGPAALEIDSYGKYFFESQ